VTPPLQLAASCLSGCGVLDSGATDQPPGGRYETRWSEMDAAAERHTKQRRHGTVVTARSPTVEQP
jgi:hypothetical protein